MEKQLTFAPRHHQLTNINVWTADSQWLVYDVRPSPSDFSGLTLERVSINGEHDILYSASDGAYVGVVTASPVLPQRYLAIHGPEHPDASWHYDFHHRRGVVIEGPAVQTLDACDITPPFTPGALRGGSHVHVYSPDGRRISFTYNDHVMHEFDIRQDLRNVGVAVPLRAVCPAKQHPREHDGSHFCVLVSQTTSQPRPGSDDISRAYEEGWVGQYGYRRADGSHQHSALAFIGDTLAVNGDKVAEVFIVDLPQSDADFAIAGREPLQGTATSLPAPPAGIMQRRLTFSHSRRWPGVVSQPRHWLRSTADGSEIAFLMKDEQGIVQLWGISPLGGEPRQISRSPWPMQSAFSWHPQGGQLAIICDNSVMQINASSGAMRRLTPRRQQAPVGDAVVWSPDGRYIAFLRQIDGWQQIVIADAY
ncbi:biopolymer transporter Tol [Erwinia sp. OLTSP20]|uniref:DUF3748 domain-containing protein n=1 Tax=unclassified Erwinia TaxID=2622719 RepID=UPI000C1A2137|nr:MULTISPECIES: DUF3748 domain-containing protein [unclassified Erwinia]PIJ49553.1 biopolymer transporter Tol [Erwinia sp. OAMSP11]PIJ72316.1 biopolymer transporter Tol [Erwinia sp. OLSSP12]PIJ81627.1 biopolymer transporter Tol [Erwinia sp. OLMDSP33]PIJ81675.1 biopolymer transporter Tol [Erwinia sp. OLCASP19]PIJ81999.1 biopolymer transporter Tol [Erwinia sp. OLMTSP26]